MRRYWFILGIKLTSKIVVKSLKKKIAVFTIKEIYQSNILQKLYYLFVFYSRSMLMDKISPLPLKKLKFWNLLCLKRNWDWSTEPKMLFIYPSNKGLSSLMDIALLWVIQFLKKLLLLEHCGSQIFFWKFDKNQTYFLKITPLWEPPLCYLEDS